MNMDSVSDSERPSCQRGDVFHADMSPVVGSELGGFRPVLIVSNDVNNRFSHTVNVIPITTKSRTKLLPVHILVPSSQSCLHEDSIILTEQSRVIDKMRLMDKYGAFSEKIMRNVDEALKIQFSLDQ